MGEITLVVIGILIALQINNWNEARKESILEQEYLLRISNDLANDTTTLQEKLKLAHSEIELYKNFTYKAYETQSSIEEFAELITSINLTAEYLILQDKTYEELASTGNANLIKDLDLRDKITGYYQSYKKARTHIEELNQTSITIAINAEEHGPTMKYFTDASGIIPSQPFMLQDENWEFINDPSSVAFRSWENVAAFYAGKQNFKSEYYTQLLVESNELIRTIEQHLKE